MSRRQRIQEHRRRMAARAYNHQAELARVREWLMRHRATVR